MPTTQRITLDPDPPEAGQPVKICYDFDGLDPARTVLKVTFGPDATPGGEHEVDEDEPCVTIDVPQHATSITVEDLEGPSPDKVAPVR